MSYVWLVIYDGSIFVGNVINVLSDKMSSDHVSNVLVIVDSS